MSFDANPYIIAEIGACHERQLAIALVLIDLAAHAGANAVKFQVYNAERLSARRKADAYRETYKKYELPHSWLADLRTRAHHNKIDLVLSVYDQEDLAVAKNYADVLKVSSFEAADRDLISACHQTGKPVIISTGLMDADEIECMFRVLHMEGLLDESLQVLHCVSAYPVAMSDLNLVTIGEHDLDGFSDHSANVLTGALAVSHGARILEVHVKAYGTSESNPDWPHSLNMAQFKEYVLNARTAKLAIGEARENILPCEQACAPYKVRP